MTVVYVGIANFHGIVLCDFSDPKLSGNFVNISRQLLQSDQLPTSNQSVTYKCDERFEFFMLIHSGLRIVVLASKSAKREAAALAQATRAKFYATYRQTAMHAREAQARTIATEFQPELKALFEGEPLENGGGDAEAKGQPEDATSAKARELRSQLDTVTRTATHGIAQAMANTGNLEALEVKSDALSLKAAQFHQQSSRVMRRMWWSSRKYQLMLAGGVLVLLIFIWLIFG